MVLYMFNIYIMIGNSFMKLFTNKGIVLLIASTTMPFLFFTSFCASNFNSGGLVEAFSRPITGGGLVAMIIIEGVLLSMVIGAIGGAIAGAIRRIAVKRAAVKGAAMGMGVAVVFYGTYGVGFLGALALDGTRIMEQNAGLITGGVIGGLIGLVIGVVVAKAILRLVDRIILQKGW